MLRAILITFSVIAASYAIQQTSEPQVFELASDDGRFYLTDQARTGVTFQRNDPTEYVAYIDAALEPARDVPMASTATLRLVVASYTGRFTDIRGELRLDYVARSGADGGAFLLPPASVDTLVLGRAETWSIVTLRFTIEESPATVEHLRVRAWFEFLEPGADFHVRTNGESRLAIGREGGS